MHFHLPPLSVETTETLTGRIGDTDWTNRILSHETRKPTIARLNETKVQNHAPFAAYAFNIELTLTQEKKHLKVLFLLQSQRCETVVVNKVQEGEGNIRRNLLL
jgi:hypothetical protein